MLRCHHFVCALREASVIGSATTRKDGEYQASERPAVGWRGSAQLPSTRCRSVAGQRHIEPMRLVLRCSVPPSRVPSRRTCLAPSSAATRRRRKHARRATAADLALTMFLRACVEISSLCERALAGAVSSAVVSIERRVDLCRHRSRCQAASQKTIDGFGSGRWIAQHLVAFEKQSGGS